MIFKDLFILLAFVWISRKFFQAIHFPPLFGEIFAGIIAGPLILGLVDQSQTLTVLAELGIFFLMFHAGLESNPKELFRASKLALFVALGGIILPFAGGFGLSMRFGYDINASLFMGLGLSVTSIALSAKLFKDCKISGTRVAHVTMAAAMIDDIIALILLAIILDVTKTGNVDLEHLVTLVGKIMAYFAIIFFVGHRYFKYLYRFFYKGNKGFTFSIILALALGLTAEMIGVPMIIGAFLAGLFLHREMIDEAVFNKIEDRIYGLSYSFLGPVFFATLAFDLELSSLGTAPLFLLLILAVAILGKVLGAGLPAYHAGMSFKESLTVGLAMNNRGAVELIIAAIGLKEGIITPELFSVLAIIALFTTILSIVIIKPLVPNLKDKNCHLTLGERLTKIVT